MEEIVIEVTAARDFLKQLAVPAGVVDAMSDDEAVEQARWRAGEIATTYNRIPPALVNYAVQAISGNHPGHVINQDAVLKRAELDHAEIQEQLAISRQLTEALLAPPVPSISVPVSFLTDLKKALEQAAQVIGDLVVEEVVQREKTALEMALADTAERMTAHLHPRTETQSSVM